MSSFKNLMSPLSIGALELPNRVVMGSMHTGLEEVPDGGDALAEFYARRARGGVGLMITGGVAPNKEGRLTPGLRGVLSKSQNMDLHENVTRAVRNEGGIIFLQILHSGRYGFHPDIVSASAVRAPINPFTPRELTSDEILQTIEDYAECAEAACAAGYHGVEIMGSEGYLITQFLAKRTNQRSDEWGGVFDNRCRLAEEIVRAVRRRVSRDFVVMFRLSLLDLVTDGSTWEEVAETAVRLQDAGVDVLNTGIGWHEARVPTIAAMVPRCAFAWVTKRLKGFVHIPVVAANRFNRPESAEAILASGKADLVSMARPLLADPDFVAKAIKGDEDRIVHCIACNQACLDHVFEGRSASCLVNPTACREKELLLSPAAKKKKIAVLGGGPAGLFFALSARERGHSVSLFEKSSSLGGQLNLAKRVPGKSEFYGLLDYLKEEMDRLDVDVHLNWPEDYKALKDGGYDAVVVAVGVRPAVPPISGVEHPKVHHYEDVLSLKIEAGQRVVILGGGGVGVDTAVFLTHDLPPGEASQTFGISREGSVADNASKAEDAMKADVPMEGEIGRFLDEWGIDRTGQVPGGLLPVEDRIVPKTLRDVTLLKRSRGKIGKGLGKTTVWIHRLALKNRGLKVMEGVVYHRVDDQGVHITTSEGNKICVPADTIVLCTGQESNADAVEGLDALLGKDVEVFTIGGAKSPSGLDAKRAIEEAVRLADEI